MGRVKIKLWCRLKRTLANWTAKIVATTFVLNAGVGLLWLNNRAANWIAYCIIGLERLLHRDTDFKARSLIRATIELQCTP